MIAGAGAGLSMRASARGGGGRGEHIKGVKEAKVSKGITATTPRSQHTVSNHSLARRLPAHAKYVILHLWCLYRRRCGLSRREVILQIVEGVKKQVFHYIVRGIRRRRALYFTSVSLSIVFLPAEPVSARLLRALNGVTASETLQRGLGHALPQLLDLQQHPAQCIQLLDILLYAAGCVPALKEGETAPLDLRAHTKAAIYQVKERQGETRKKE